MNRKIQIFIVSPPSQATTCPSLLPRCCAACTAPTTRSPTEAAWEELLIISVEEVEITSMAPEDFTTRALGRGEPGGALGPPRPPPHPRLLIAHLHLPSNK